MKRYEEEWKRVIDKIWAFRGLLNDVGTLCVKYGLKREHLPHEVLQKTLICMSYIPDTHVVCSSYLSKLDGLNHELTQARNDWIVARVISGADLTRTIQRCDWECSNLVQNFEVWHRFICFIYPTHRPQSALRDARLGSEQVAEGSSVRTLPPNMKLTFQLMLPRIQFEKLKALHSGPPQPMYPNNMAAMGPSQSQSWVLHQPRQPPPLVHAPPQHGYVGNVPGPAQTQLHRSTGHPINWSETL